MHDENAHYSMRVYQKGNCYASSPLVDAPLNYSSRNVPYINALDSGWDIFLIRDVRYFSLVEVRPYALTVDGFSLNDRAKEFDGVPFNEVFKATINVVDSDKVLNFRIVFLKIGVLTVYPKQWLTPANQMSTSNYTMKYVESDK